MTRPDYKPLGVWYSAPDGWATDTLNSLMSEIEWESVKSTRKEYFMAADERGCAQIGVVYNYGVPPHDHNYVSRHWHPAVSEIQTLLNRMGYSVFEMERRRCTYNVCFLNRYDDEKNQLGWHSDDSPGMLHEHPIAVVSFGEPREIWVRKKGVGGVVPAEDRYLLEHGSLFIMPAGFQLTHQHRIPKGSRKMGPRISLTFRRFVPTVTP